MLVARLALLWFALTLGVAVASPLMQARAPQDVCRAGSTLAGNDTDRHPGSAAHTLDCVQCLPASAPPALLWVPSLAPAVIGTVAQAWVLAAAPSVAQARAPLPPRGPPLRF